MLHITRQAVDKRRKAGKLLAVDLGRRGYFYPVWQFTDSGALPGLEEILKEFKGRSSWEQLRFFLNTNPRLGGRTPLQKLKEGDIDIVQAAVRGTAEHGAA